MEGRKNGCAENVIYSNKPYYNINVSLSTLSASNLAGSTGMKYFYNLYYF
jgi:hypothetical protein